MLRLENLEKRYPTGDLAPGNGAQLPLQGGFSGLPGGPVDGKAAFNHAPYAYGVGERTYSSTFTDDSGDFDPEKIVEGFLRCEVER